MRESKATLGAIYDGTGTSFRVWAPDHDRVDLVIESGHLKVAPTMTGDSGRLKAAPTTTGEPDVGAAFRRPSIRALQRDASGYWAGRFDDVLPGTRYRYRLNGSSDQTFPDPASRYQPDGVHGASEVVDPASFKWTDEAWRAPSLDRMVFYELHLGTFSPQGTYRGAIERLPLLSELGVTTIELMPVADFPGDRNWGYDGVAIFAPARAYGTPDDLRALVDAAHRLGLAVVLDVVYNHLGPDGAYANAFSSHYFSAAHASPWGQAVNLDGPHSAEVRRFFIENALHWVCEYHLDGLRLDATHALHDSSNPHFLAELKTTVRQEAPRPVVFIAEDYRNLAKMLQPVERGGYALDGVWADDFHHQMRVHTAGDREGYYVDYTGTAADLATTLRQGWFFTGQPSAHLHERRGTDPSGLAPWQLVICIQNHDQIGNRADGARLNHQIDPAAYRAASALFLLAPQSPLLFMGQEWAASSPFLFFTDHHEALGRLVTAGRREEFSGFAAFSEVSRRMFIPDPQSASTFDRSRLHWDERDTDLHAGTLRLYKRLLALRAERLDPVSRREAYEVTALDDHTVSMSYRDRSLLVIARLSGGPGCVSVTTASRLTTVLTTEDSHIVELPEPIQISTERSAPDRWTLKASFARPGAIVLAR